MVLLLLVSETRVLSAGPAMLPLVLCLLLRLRRGILRGCPLGLLTGRLRLLGFNVLHCVTQALQLSLELIVAQGVPCLLCFQVFQQPLDLLQLLLLDAVLELLTEAMDFLAHLVQLSPSLDLMRPKLLLQVLELLFQGALLRSGLTASACPIAIPCAFRSLLQPGLCLLQVLLLVTGKATGPHAGAVKRLPRVPQGRLRMPGHADGVRSHLLRHIGCLLRRVGSRLCLVGIKGCILLHVLRVCRIVPVLRHAGLIDACLDAHRGRWHWEH
mmetsp:Transcript_112447/g.363097  ORF Transcript_112447/g.363097 Transcript_112447/m.363097 type:complete len:270 (+) Transcript_112447:578-1387(+)